MSDEIKEPNPKLWREMQEPHASIEAANEASRGFYEELGALREKYRMADLLVVCRVRVVIDGDEREALTPTFYGEWLRAESMAAYAYGHYAGERQQAISDYINGKALTRQASKRK